MLKKRSLLNNKKGAFTTQSIWGSGASNVHKWITSIGLFIAVILIIFSYFLAFCGSITIFGYNLNLGSAEKASLLNSKLITPNSALAIESNITQKGFVGYYYRSLYWSADKLGFNTGYTEIQKYGSCWGYWINTVSTTAGFFFRILMGTIAGFWLWFFSQVGRALLASIAWFRDKGAQQSRWMQLIAGSAWKMFAVGLGYGVLMQVPVVNAVIKIITLESFGLNKFLVTFVIAFWVGLAPAWIEDYHKYRIRIKAEQAVAYAKARAAIEKSSMQR